MSQIRTQKQVLCFHVLWETRPRIYISLLFFFSPEEDSKLLLRQREEKWLWALLLFSSEICFIKELLLACS